MCEFRKIEKKDEEGVRELLKQLTDKEINFDINLLISDSACHCFVMEDGGNVVGTASIVVYVLPTKGKVGKVEDVVVDVSQRGKGYGRKIMQLLLEEAQKQGLKAVQLTSSPRREAAWNLYESLGFEMKDTNVFVLNL